MSKVYEYYMEMGEETAGSSYGYGIPHKPNRAYSINVTFADTDGYLTFLTDEQGKRKVLTRTENDLVTAADLTVRVNKELPQAINDGLTVDDIELVDYDPYASEDQEVSELLYGLEYLQYYLGGEKGMRNAPRTYDR